CSSNLDKFLHVFCRLVSLDQTHYTEARLQKCWISMESRASIEIVIAVFSTCSLEAGSETGSGRSSRLCHVSQPLEGRAHLGTLTPVPVAGLYRENQLVRSNQFRSRPHPCGSASRP